MFALSMTGCLRANYMCSKTVHADIQSYVFECSRKSSNAMKDISRCQKEASRFYGCNRSSIRFGNLGVINYDN